MRAPLYCFSVSEDLSSKIRMGLFLIFGILFKMKNDPWDISLLSSKVIAILRVFHPKSKRTGTCPFDGYCGIQSWDIF